MDIDKKLRRKIANWNERRRMESINTGFQTLQRLLPHHEGNKKLGKAAILQETAFYIRQLEQDKKALVDSMSQLKTPASANGKSPEASCSSRCPGHGSSDEIVELKRGNRELSILLERERHHRVTLEEHIRILERRAQQPQLQSTQFVQETLYRPAPTPGRVVNEAPRCCVIKNNLDSIVEAIRHLEGDNIFVDDSRYSSRAPTTSPCLAFPTPSGSVKACSSPGSSPSRSQSTVELPVPMRSSISSTSYLPQSSGSSYFPSRPATVVTNLNVLNRSALASAVGEKPKNLEFRSGFVRNRNQKSTSLPQSSIHGTTEMIPNAKAARSGRRKQSFVDQSVEKNVLN